MVVNSTGAPFSRAMTPRTSWTIRASPLVSLRGFIMLDVARIVRR